MGYVVPITGSRCVFLGDLRNSAMSLAPALAAAAAAGTALIVDLHSGHIHSSAQASVVPEALQVRARARGASA